MSSVIGAARHPGSRKVTYFGSTHPLADAARRRCRVARHGTGRTLVGEVACGRCWETTIRTDEQVVIECGLPREIVVDRSFVDEIAVARALHGEPVALTSAERQEAIRRLARQGLSKAQVWRRLQVTRMVGVSSHNAGTASPAVVGCETAVAA